MMDRVSSAALQGTGALILEVERAQKIAVEMRTELAYNLAIRKLFGLYKLVWSLDHCVRSL
jgi:hypothetical protein